MSGRIQKSYFFLLAGNFTFRFVSRNMLGDATLFFFSYIRFPHIIKQGRLTVIDMAHHDDDRRPGYKVIGFFFHNNDHSTSLLSFCKI